MSHAEQPHQQAEALKLAHRLSVAMHEKEEAIARQDFEHAAQRREAELECLAQLHALPVPTYVMANLVRHASGPSHRKSPFLDLLATDPGTADATIVAQWPATVASPLRLAFAQIPESASGTLRAVLNVDDIFSTYLEPLLPVLSAETFAKIHLDRCEQVLPAMVHELSRSKRAGVPTVLSLVAPTSFLDPAMQSILIRGLKETECDFVIFEHAQAIAGLAQALQPEIILATPPATQG